MYQLRIYTLRTADALEDYASVHWPRHIPSLRVFGVTTHGIWTDHDTGVHRLLALISYPEGADPAGVLAAYMGFDVSNIINVEELLLDPTAASPLS